MIKKMTSIWSMFPIICSAVPPYTGTIFINPDILTKANPSALSSTRFLSRKTVNMFDRRVNAFINVDAYTFQVEWNDNPRSVAAINTEFGSLENAALQAEKYAFKIGQLPAALRADVDEIWIHKGLQPFGGGNRSILIHTEQADLYEAQGIMEETLIHEACHTSLDFKHSNSSGWSSAQALDNEYISDYAKQNPSREDVAESFLPWLAVRFRKDAISAEDSLRITQTIPNRLNYFDTLSLDLRPFNSASTSIKYRRYSDQKFFRDQESNIPHGDQNAVTYDLSGRIQRRLQIKNTSDANGDHRKRILSEILKSTAQQQTQKP